LGVARQLLSKRFSPAPELSESARVSEKVLARGFKAVYGETAFEFGVRRRMEHALELLRDQGWSVERVSEVAGYAHAASFATAFRRHFGIRPMDLKIERRSRANALRHASNAIDPNSKQSCPVSPREPTGTHIIFAEIRRDREQCSGIPLQSFVGKR
jgi:AraC-like DNA-binding protein